MKKLLSLLLIVLFSVNYLHAQTSEVLTNTTIIKMVKGKLSDELIIDEINNSKVNFDLSSESITVLLNANVSEKVIQAMKAVNTIQNPGTPKETVLPASTAPSATPLNQVEKSIQTSTVAAIDTLKDQAAEQSQNSGALPPLKESLYTEKDTITESIAVASPPEQKTTLLPVAQVIKSKEQPAVEIIKPELPLAKLTVGTLRTENGISVLVEQPAIIIETISYVEPVTQLIPFYNNQFSSMAGVIKDWDKKLRASLQNEKQNIEATAKIEKKLTDKKNADARIFSQEIMEQKKNLALSWEERKKIKADMVTEGKSLVEELKKISKTTDSEIDAKYREVSKNVKSAVPDPSVSEAMKTVNIPIQKFNCTITEYFAPVSMMLACYQNEIISVQNTINTWNNLALNRIKKDAELKSQLAPFQDELSQYLSTTKQNQKLKKKEISSLKKQCDAIEKERKQLAKQMSDDNSKLSEELNKMKTEVQAVVLQRFTDIIENIEHTYQDKFNL
ncbi:MAG: hypothetical protein Q7U54_09975 [Bacteroidales bacterium]|nr:hypothetical protein [Bacteroidales bacterium]